ncbi:MAG: hypothetical protein KDB70_04280 [Mycobacterium sp.]|nr:hypothetical protein [Mycobacterium sp.]
MNRDEAMGAVNHLRASIARLEGPVRRLGMPLDLAPFRERVDGLERMAQHADYPVVVKMVLQRAVRISRALDDAIADAKARVN